MNSMFSDASAFNQPLSVDTSSVTTMSYMFYDASAFNQPLSVDTSKVTDMYFMFGYASAFNQPLPQLRHVHVMVIRCAWEDNSAFISAVVMVRARTIRDGVREAAHEGSRPLRSCAPRREPAP